MDVELEGVEGDGLGVLGHIKVNDNSAIEGELLEVDFQGQIVMGGDDVRGEELSSWDIDSALCGGLSCAGVSAHVVSSVRAVTNRLLDAQGGSPAASVCQLTRSYRRSKQRRTC